MFAVFFLAFRQKAVKSLLSSSDDNFSRYLSSLGEDSSDEISLQNALSVARAFFVAFWVFSESFFSMKSWISVLDKLEKHYFLVSSSI